MLQNFEDITYDLTDQEKGMVPILVKGLSAYVGASKAISNKSIIAKVEQNHNVKLTDVRVRKLINYIRMHNLLPGLIASSRGYYISNNPAEVKQYIESLEGRIKAIDGIAKQFKQHLFKITANQQQHLFNH